MVKLSALVMQQLSAAAARGAAADLLEPATRSSSGIDDDPADASSLPSSMAADVRSSLETKNFRQLIARERDAAVAFPPLPFGIMCRYMVGVSLGQPQ